MQERMPTRYQLLHGWMRNDGVAPSPPAAAGIGRGAAYAVRFACPYPDGGLHLVPTVDGGRVHPPMRMRSRS